MLQWPPKVGAYCGRTGYVTILSDIKVTMDRSEIQLLQYDRKLTNTVFVSGQLLADLHLRGCVAGRKHPPHLTPLTKSIPDHHPSKADKSFGSSSWS